MLVTSFSSNVGRIRFDRGGRAEAGREVMLLGRSMKRVVDVATEIGYMEGLSGFVGEGTTATIPRDKLVVILTGSQGEPRAALAKLAATRCATSASRGRQVIYSSRTIPGNEPPSSIP